MGWKHDTTPHSGPEPSHCVCVAMGPVILLIVTENTDAAYKEALFGVCTLLLELARLDVDAASIR